MIPPGLSRLAWPAVLAIVVVALSGCGDASASPSAPAAAAPAGSAAAALGHLRVRPPAALTGYSRAQFGPAWADVDHTGCDQRNQVLSRDLTGVTLRKGSRCVVASGHLSDPYTGRQIAFVRGPGTSEAVQIDHVVALAAAWRTGAQELSPTARAQLAGDPLELLAVDGPTNVLEYGRVR